MTTDVGGLFWSALTSVGTWDHDDVRQALELLAGSEFRVDWEPGDEEWGRVIDAGGSVRALVCARVPIGIAHEDVDEARLSKRVSWTSVSSMREKLFRVDRALLEHVFGRHLSDNVDYSRLSVDDLWWATVS